jgi:hypothetical protein
MIEYDHGDEIPAFLLRSSHSGRKFIKADGTLRCGLSGVRIPVCTRGGARRNITGSTTSGGTGTFTQS